MKSAYPLFKYLMVLFQLILNLLVMSCAVSPEPELPLNTEQEPEPNVIQKPTLTLLEVHEITRSSAIVMGEVKSSGGDSLISTGIVYRTMNGNNIIVNSSNNGSLYFMINLAELEGGTEYFIKSFAENSAGISYSDEISFETLPYTSPVLSINQTVDTKRGFMAVVECAVPDDGGKIVREKGICWSTKPEPTLSDNKITSSSDSLGYEIVLNGVQENTTYYLRGYAINEIGTTYSETIVIVVDIDGNVYNTVKIGKQRWTVENLKTTRLNNGVDIAHAQENEIWRIPPVINMTGDPNFKNPYIYPRYCWYDNDINNKKDYGALYNWHAVGTGYLAPKGWRVPSHDDFAEFINLLDPEIEKKVYPKMYGDSLDVVQYSSKTLGLKMKVPHFSEMWDGSNETGLSVIPAGLRQGSGEFQYIGIRGESYKYPADNLTGYWCTSDIYIENVVDAIAYWFLVGPNPSGTAILWTGGKDQGFSIRCIMN